MYFVPSSANRLKSTSSPASRPPEAVEPHTATARTKGLCRRRSRVKSSAMRKYVSASVPFDLRRARLFEMRSSCPERVANPAWKRMAEEAAAAAATSEGFSGPPYRRSDSSSPARPYPQRFAIRRVVTTRSSRDKFTDKDFKDASRPCPLLGGSTL